jgi:hypothetical protein
MAGTENGSVAAEAIRFGRRNSERAARLIAALAADGRRLEAADDGRYELRIGSGQAPCLVASADLVAAMYRRDWLQPVGANGFTVGEAGLAWLRRRQTKDDPWRAQHLATESRSIETEDGRKAVATVVANESPLAWLRRRRGGDGQPLVSEVQFQAGERLRAEFERGRLGPRVTADWTSPARDRNPRGPDGGPGDLLDTAIAARQRVDAAIRALGPDLGSLLIDVCCFLVGLEDAERRRGWPRRSAKVVLGIALDRLAAHYGLSETAVGAARSRRILHWGAEDFRPRIDEAPPDAEPGNVS